MCLLLIASGSTARADVEGFGWIDRRLDDIRQALYRLDPATPEDERGEYPLQEIQFAQTACELIRGEINTRKPSNRLPRDVKTSQSAHQAVLMLCIDLAQQKDRITRGYMMDRRDIRLMELQVQQTRDIMAFASSLKSSASWQD
ncbi:MAG: hypothetical protein CMK07_03000 [Ponticaulis sp.]|nr:hypothetical protein [Ponticaulis sp.]